MAESGAVEAVKKLERELSELRRMLSERTDTRDRSFDQLYEELKQYKEEFVYQGEKPLLLDLLLFYDSLCWFKESLVKPETTPDVVADSFQYLVDEFLELLYRRDVIPMEASTRFDRKMHKAVKTVECDKKEDDQRVTQVLKRGFARNDKMLRPEEVVIARFRGSDGAG